MYVEIKPGEGGDDAAAFAAEIAAAVRAHAHRSGATVTELSPDSRTTVYEMPESAAVAALAGVHRVQRVPANDKRGRRQTSTATVAVLPDVPESAAVLRRGDVRIDYFRGSGPGGQHRNKTSSAVRVTHAETGTVITRTSGRSQRANRAAAEAELADRLTAGAGVRTHERRNEHRRAQLSGGGRPAKSFTHNYQRGSVTDHGSGRTWTLRQFAHGRFDQ